MKNTSRYLLLLMGLCGSALSVQGVESCEEFFPVCPLTNQQKDQQNAFPRPILRQECEELKQDFLKWANIVLPSCENKDHKDSNDYNDSCGESCGKNCSHLFSSLYTDESNRVNEIIKQMAFKAVIKNKLKLPSPAILDISELCRDYCKQYNDTLNSVHNRVFSYRALGNIGWIPNHEKYSIFIPEKLKSSKILNMLKKLHGSPFTIPEKQIAYLQEIGLKSRYGGDKSSFLYYNISQFPESILKSEYIFNWMNKSDQKQKILDELKEITTSVCYNLNKIYEATKNRAIDSEKVLLPEQQSNKNKAHKCYLDAKNPNFCEYSPVFDTFREHYMQSFFQKKPPLNLLQMAKTLEDREMRAQLDDSVEKNKASNSDTTHCIFDILGREFPKNVRIKNEVKIVTFYEEEGSFDRTANQTDINAANNSFYCPQDD